MVWTTDMIREIVVEAAGFDPGPAEIERLRSLVERQAEQLRALEALDLGSDDPRDMAYIADYRLDPFSPAHVSPAHVSREPG